MIYQDKVKVNQAAFIAKVRQIASLLQIDPDWLMIIMNFESAGTFSPSIPNGMGSGGVGLIQFMPKTAIGLGTTTAALAKMSNVQQLDYVYKYFKPKAGQYKSGEDLYLFTFFPIAVGKPDYWTIESTGMKAATIAHQNPGLDLNKDGKITIGEWKEALRKLLSKRIKDPAVFDIFFKKKV